MLSGDALAALARGRSGRARRDRADDPAFIVYTSGSSGKPQGRAPRPPLGLGAADDVAGWYGLRADDVMLHAGAFNWTYTLGAGLLDPWAAGRHHGDL
jgi:4-hydroxybenzoate-CoA ligase